MRYFQGCTCGRGGAVHNGLVLLRCLQVNRLFPWPPWPILKNSAPIPAAPPSIHRAPVQTGTPVGWACGARESGQLGKWDPVLESQTLLIPPGLLTGSQWERAVPRSPRDQTEYPRSQFGWSLQSRGEVRRVGPGRVRKSTAEQAAYR